MRPCRLIKKLSWKLPSEKCWEREAGSMVVETPGKIWYLPLQILVYIYICCGRTAWIIPAQVRMSGDINSTHFRRNNPLVCRVSARCNHGSIGLKQVYLARRRVYSRTTAHQLLIHRVINIITNQFKLKVINKYSLKR
jgi:hypothetical protein